MTVDDLMYTNDMEGILNGAEQIVCDGPPEGISKIHASSLIARAKSVVSYVRLIEEIRDEYTDGEVY